MALNWSSKHCIYIHRCGCIGSEQSNIHNTASMTLGVW